MRNRPTTTVRTNGTSQLDFAQQLTGIHKLTIATACVAEYLKKMNRQERARALAILKAGVARP